MAKPMQKLYYSIGEVSGLLKVKPIRREKEEARADALVKIVARPAKRLEGLALTEDPVGPHPVEHDQDDCAGT